MLRRLVVDRKIFASFIVNFPYDNSHRLSPSQLDLSKTLLTSYRPGSGSGETICPGDGSSTRDGSTSVRGRVRSPHISGGRWWLQPRVAAPWDRQTDGQTDGQIAVSLNPSPPLQRGHRKFILLKTYMTTSIACFTA